MPRTSRRTRPMESGLRTAPGPEGPLTAVTAQLRAWHDEGMRLVVVAASDTQRDRLQVLLRGHDIETLASGAVLPQALATSGRAALALVGSLSRGVRLPLDGLVLVTESEIFGERRAVRRGRRSQPADFLSTLAELHTDDYVVHLDHGVGVYRGLRHMQVAGTQGDYLHLEYLGGDRLYVPVDRIAVVQRYVGADGAAPGARQARRDVMGAGQGEDQGIDPRHGARSRARLRRA